MAMTTSKKLEIGLAILVVLVVVIGGVYALTKSDAKDNDTSGQNTSQGQGDHVHEEETAPVSSIVDADDPSVKEAAATLTYTNDGFNPDEITVKSGDKVAVKNTSSEDLEFESGPHPAHTSNSELNQGAVAPGEAVVFTVSTQGTFSVHNHLNPGKTAKVTVE